MEVSSYQSHEGLECKSDWRDPVSGPRANSLTQPMRQKGRSQIHHMSLTEMCLVFK